MQQSSIQWRIVVAVILQIDQSQVMNNLSEPEGSGKAGVFPKDDTK